MKHLLVGAMTAFALAAPTHAEHLAPRNECSALAGADQFRRALVTAVANRDAAMLKPLVDPQVHLDFGGGHGWDLMQERLVSEDYQLWEELDQVVRLGCARGYEDSLVMPYYWAQDIGERDPYGTYVVLGDRVPLFAREEGERVLRHLRWQYVELIAYLEHVDGIEDAVRLEVKLEDGTRGYVERAKLRALIDYRLLAERREGRWVITTFIAGD